MEPRFDWSLGIGRWFGVRVRVHLLFFLFVLLIGCVEWMYLARSPSMAGTSVVYALGLLLCVLIRELARIGTNVSLGGNVQSLVLTPWGGFAETLEPVAFRDRTLVAASGIFASFALFLIGAMAILQTGKYDLSDLTYAFSPPVFNSFDPVASSAVIFVWLSFQITIFNLLPTYPFDCAQLMRTVFGKVNDDSHDLKVESTVKAIGQLCGAVLIGIGILQRNYSGTPMVPLWGIFVGGGIAIFFAARYDFRRRIRDMCDQIEVAEQVFPPQPLMDGLLDSQSGFDFLVEENGYSQWLIEKQRSRDQGGSFDDELSEQEELRQADQILEKLHRAGIESLSEDERNILERVSARIRQKRKVDQID